MILEQLRHWMFTLDPVHVGSGREQLTRIDLPHVREKGTDLPVIPGTSLSGSCRAYAALQYNPKCAGKGGDDGSDHCGTCEVCLAFGFSNGKEKKSRQGLVQISTAHILFFPVASSHGPVWITSRQQLEDAGLPAGDSVPHARFRAAWGLTPVPALLDLSWNNLAVFGAPGNGQHGDAVGKPAVFADRIKRAVVVSDEDFGELVRVNMEVRTLVSINPETGAAKDGALFTYEAIPRGALLWFDVVHSNPAHYGITTKPDTKAVTKNGFNLMKFLGLGGMNTRGMGRVEIASGECVHV